MPRLRHTFDTFEVVRCCYKLAERLQRARRAVFRALIRVKLLNLNTFFLQIQIKKKRDGKRGYNVAYTRSLWPFFFTVYRLHSV